MGDLKKRNSIIVNEFINKDILLEKKTSFKNINFTLNKKRKMG